MNDEELSELAECLEDACCEKAASKPGMGHEWGQYCPLGALFNFRFTNKPLVSLVPLDIEISSGIAAGFDGELYDAAHDIRAYALGMQFRERYP